MKLALKILVPIVILTLAYFAFKKLETLRPSAEQKSVRIAFPEVDTIQVSISDHQPPIRSFGTVRPLFETTLTPQVSGEIIEVSKIFQVGNMVKHKMILARIDATDYQAALAREQSGLEVARRTLAEEKIRASQAKQDWLASGRKLKDASDFVLRKPQLAAADASILSSEAAVAKAVADIERTVIRAPYDAVITSRTASLGNLASPQMALGTLVATSKVEVRLPLTVEQVSRIVMPAPGLPVQADVSIKLTTPKSPGTEWKASVVRTEPAVDPQNQVTYVIAEVQYPYTVMEQPLAVGTFVNASIPARMIKNTLRIPEEALVNDAYVWTVIADNTLEKIDVNRVYSLDGDAYVRLINDDGKTQFSVISRPLANFRSGMEVKPTNNEE
jgi:RND family efflux transporter MFP subunit